MISRQDLRREDGLLLADMYAYIHETHLPTYIRTRIHVYIFSRIHSMCTRVTKLAHKMTRSLCGLVDTGARLRRASERARHESSSWETRGDNSRARSRSALHRPPSSDSNRSPANEFFLFFSRTSSPSSLPSSSPAFPEI